MAPPVFQAKLRRPPPVGLRRDRLEGALIGPDAPLVSLVVAPPGSGKTTLLAQTAAASRWRVAWYAAGPEDRAEESFVRHIAESASTVLPERLVARTLEDLICALDSHTSPLTLVVDDVHELSCSGAEAALERLVRLRPTVLRLILGSRRPPRLNMPRMLLSHEITTLDGDSLRFRSWEVEELFRSVYGEPLSPEGAAALTRQTGGWAAGLQLFHLATSGKPAAERERAVSDLGGRSRLIRSYLTRNVLDELDSSRREFLILTSSLGVLTAPLCDALLNSTGSAQILEQLESQQFFTSSSPDGRTYVYHQVLQTHLAGELLNELGPVGASALYSRSGRLLEEAGHLREATRAYALADDWGSVARLVQEARAGFPVAWCGLVDGPRLPDDDPWLAVVRARRLLRDGSVEQSVATYREAESMLDDVDFRSRCAEERDVAGLWLGQARALRLRSTVRASDPPTLALATLVRRATLGLPSREASASEMTHPLARGLLSLLGGDLQAAGDQLAEAASWPGGSVFERLSGELASTVVDLMGGATANGVARLEEIALTAEVEEQPWLARLARGLLESLLLVTRPAEWRPEACAALQAECRARGDGWGAALLGLCMGVAHAISGDLVVAEQYLERSAAAARDLDAPVVEAWAATLASRVVEALDGTSASARRQAATDLRRAVGLLDIEPVIARLVIGSRGGSEVPAARISAENTAERVVVLRCLGQFSIDVDGWPIDLDGLKPRARSLLLRLAMCYDRDVHREVLIEALWPGASPDLASHRLHVAASTVRKSLDRAGLAAPTVHRRGESYRLTLDGATWDVGEFERCLQEANRERDNGDVETAACRWSRALDHYAGDLLPELGPTEWVVGERERLRLDATQAAISLAETQLDRDMAPDAVAAAHRAVELDPLRDSSWQMLVAAQERVGDHRAAARTRLLQDRLHGCDAAAPLPPSRRSVSERPSRPPRSLGATRGQASSSPPRR